eukprot:TRINITY_DN238_c0_g2_i3.p1 TRINITY_DN238_c0_g2~~TRINITY_DN238_c0_g2_i3.p1  ORF type:complete len:633 (+),score=147.85 TRINITY_DN238_c0_g2_i3:147-1901(+)
MEGPLEHGMGEGPVFSFGRLNYPQSLSRASSLLPRPHTALARPVSATSVPRAQSSMSDRRSGSVGIAPRFPVAGRIRPVSALSMSRAAAPRSPSPSRSLRSSRILWSGKLGGSGVDDDTEDYSAEYGDDLDDFVMIDNDDCAEDDPADADDEGRSKSPDAEVMRAYQRRSSSKMSSSRPDSAFRPGSVSSASGRKIEWDRDGERDFDASKSGGGYPSEIDLMEEPRFQSRELPQFDEERRAPTNDTLGLFLEQSADHLHELVLDGRTYLSDISLGKIGEYGGNLRILNLRGCHQLSNSTLKAIIHGCLSLVVLDVSECPLISDDSIEEIPLCLSNLQCLSLSGCDRVTGHGLQKGSRLEKLKLLDVSYCQNLMDIALWGLSGAPLEELNVSGCRKITSRGLYSLFSGCRTMKSLAMKNCNQDGLTIAPLESLVRWSKDITVLLLSGMTQITDALIVPVIQKCASLELLHLGGTDIGDITLSAIAESCTKLATLSLCGCRNVSVTVLAVMLERMGESFVQLDVTGCNVTPADVETLSKIRSHVSVACHRFVPIEYVKYQEADVKKKGKKKGKKGKKGKGKKKKKK